jgi:hypothetical protein
METTPITWGATIAHKGTVRVTQVIKNAPIATQENLRVTRVNLVVKTARPGNTVTPVPRLYLSFKETMVHASLLAPNTPMNQPPAVLDAQKDGTKILSNNQVVKRAPPVMNRIQEVYCFVTVARLVNTKMSRESQSAKVAPRVDMVQLSMHQRSLIVIFVPWVYTKTNKGKSSAKHAEWEKKATLVGQQVSRVVVWNVWQGSIQISLEWLNAKIVRPGHSFRILVKTTWQLAPFALLEHIKMKKVVQPVKIVLLDFIKIGITQRTVCPVFLVGIKMLKDKPLVLIVLKIQHHRNWNVILHVALVRSAGRQKKGAWRVRNVWLGNTKRPPKVE